MVTMLKEDDYSKYEKEIQAYEERLLREGDVHHKVWHSRLLHYLSHKNTLLGDFYSQVTCDGFYIIDGVKLEEYLVEHHGYEHYKLETVRTPQLYNETNYMEYVSGLIIQRLSMLSTSTYQYLRERLVRLKSVHVIQSEQDVARSVRMDTAYGLYKEKGVWEEQGVHYRRLSYPIHLPTIPKLHQLVIHQFYDSRTKIRIRMSIGRIVIEKEKTYKGKVYVYRKEYDRTSGESLLRELGKLEKYLLTEGRNIFPVEDFMYRVHSGLTLKGRIKI